MSILLFMKQNEILLLKFYVMVIVLVLWRRSHFPEINGDILSEQWANMNYPFDL